MNVRCKLGVYTTTSENQIAAVEHCVKPNKSGIRVFTFQMTPTPLYYALRYNGNKDVLGRLTRTGEQIHRTESKARPMPLVCHFLARILLRYDQIKMSDTQAVLLSAEPSFHILWFWT